MTTKQEALEYIVGLNLPEFVKNLYLQPQDISDISIFIGCPTEYFLLSTDQQRIYSKDLLIPIVDNGNFDSVVFHDPKANYFIELSAEDPFNPKGKFKNFNQVIFNVFCRVCESYESINEIKDLCVDLEILDSFKKWYDFVKELNKLSYSDYNLRKREIIESIVRRI